MEENRKNEGHHKYFRFSILGKRLWKHKDFFEIFISEMISITGGLIAGLFLLNIKNSLEFVPALLILLPGFLELQGNLLGSLAARLSVALHLRKMKPKFNHGKIFISNILATVFLAFFVSIILGIVAYFITKFIFRIAVINIIFIAITATALALVAEIPLTIIATLWTFKVGLDPDDIMGPYVTTAADIISVIAILIAIVLFV